MPALGDQAAALCPARPYLSITGCSFITEHVRRDQHSLPHLTVRSAERATLRPLLEASELGL